MRALQTEQQEMFVEAAERMADNGLSAAQAVVAGGEWPIQPDATLLGDWSGLGVPEERGGAGGGLVDLALVVNALAKQLVPTRYIAHAMAVQVANAAALSLGPALDGSETWCLAASESGSGPTGPFATQCAGDRVSGRKIGVPFGAIADRAVVTCADGQVAIASPSRRNELVSADLLSPSAELVFDDADALAGDGAHDGLMRAMAILAAELCGVAQGAVALGAGYACDREQFGRPIGAFQGVAHQLSDAMVEAEGAWSLALYACWSLDNGAADAPKAVHLAKSKAADAAVFAAERTLHVHGGMGMTWEAAPHLYLRRALAHASWLGGAHWHRRQAGAGLLRAVRDQATL